MRIRKTELQELTDLLSAPHDSVEDLVNVVWKRIDESRRVHEAYVILVNHGGGIILSYGIYDTRAAAEKDLTKFRSTTGAERATITKLLSSSQFFDFDNAEDYR
jgi:hypothetical protein